MQLKTWLILGIASVLLGCGPKAPKLNFCALDANSFLGVVSKALKDGTDRSHIVALVESYRPIYCDGVDGPKDLTLLEANKYVMQPMEDAEKLRDYVIALEQQVARCH